MLNFSLFTKQNVNKTFVLSSQAAIESICCQASNKKEAEKKKKIKGQQAEGTSESGATKLGAFWIWLLYGSVRARIYVCLHKQAVAKDRDTHQRKYLSICKNILGIMTSRYS